LVIDRLNRDAKDMLIDVPGSAAITEINHLTLHGRWRQLFRHTDAAPFPAAPPLPQRFVDLA
jgi:hypothetical protein